ncbi:hypothetical protein AC1659_28305 [Rhodococcus erythropolis]|uniref:pilin n=1 Tax=Rhodococcus erythropolis group TaxID=2840174 RepID=UPI000BB2E07B|nr:MULTISPECIES: pilin [Rhodococcus erythropolis group]MBS2993204.1 hypothetical protein [Rhodococcus erythropolis]PBI91075.1 hypothetical protein BKP42_54270 [Rhodococcus erythropolis]
MATLLATVHTAYHAASVDVLAQIGTNPPQRPPGADKFDMLLSWVKWGGVILAVAGLVIGGVMLAMERNGTRDGDGKGKIIGAMIGAVVIGLAPAVINQLSS